MASLSTDKNGNRTIQFVGADRKRRSIRLGKVAKKEAETIQRHIEHLASAGRLGGVVSDHVAAWVAGLSPDFADKLYRVGLIPKPKHRRDEEQKALLLGEFTQQYIDRRSDLKDASKTKLGLTRKYLVSHFGADRPLVSITPGDADDFRVFLVAQSLSENTIRKHICNAKQFCHAARRRKLIDENPFEGLKSTVQENPERFFYVTREMAEKVLDACPDAEWRLIFALSRYGGLRCPSEHLALRWEDINWEHERFVVRSPKTEHHVGRASRVVPIFPELRPYLEDMRELAGDSEYVITRYRDATANLRTPLDRVITRAGLVPWPKRFQNLRSTRQTELEEQFPSHVVCAWMGNSKAVAAKHYLQVTDSHFDKAVQKAVQNPAVTAGKPQKSSDQPGKAEGEKPVFLPEFSAICEEVNNCSMGLRGVEPPRP